MPKVIRKLVRTIKQQANALFAPYIITATYWDKWRSVSVRHYAWSWDDAISWMACYPNADRVKITKQPLLSCSKPKLLAAR